MVDRAREMSSGEGNMALSRAGAGRSVQLLSEDWLVEDEWRAA